jgi:tripartite-type tricarboxylate transporter receptor subunit TctC
MSESFPGFFSTTWYAVVAPPKTSSTIAEKLSSAIAETVRMPDVAKKFQEQSVTPVGSSPTETAAFLKRETQRWREVIVTVGIKPD